MNDVTPIGPRLDQRRRQLLTRLLAAHNDGDVDAVLACFAHPRYEMIAHSRVYNGGDEVRRHLTSVRRTFPDIRFDLVEVHHGADAVVCELWMSGTHLGSTGDVEATGRCFRCRAVAVYAFDGDALIGARVYYDTGTIARQLA